ncbi:MAG TPA: DUF881 domain-containing protein [Jatrophihabitans sp.]|jgi:uncharacterized protein YlxW (UPF0749 family)
MATRGTGPGPDQPDQDRTQPDQDPTETAQNGTETSHNDTEAGQDGAGPEEDRPRWPRNRNHRATALIGTLLALLGFALAVQVRSNSQTDALASAREDDLVRILDDQNSRIERLQRQINDLQTARQRLSDSGNNNAVARQEAQRQADALAVLTGAAPAHGPGIRVSITDPLHALRAEQLLDVVEELRGAGAEVIQFGPVRIGTSSAFTDSGSGVSLDRTALQPPYQVLAIGDPKTLNTALNIQGGVVNTVHAAGGEVAIAEQPMISITATRTIPAPKYATPTGK